MIGWAIAQTIMIGTPAIAQTPRDPLSYSQLLKKIDAGEVTKVEIDEAQKVARVKLEGQKPNDPLVEVPLLERNPELIERLRANKVNFDSQPTADNSALMGIVANLLLFVLVIAGLLMILRRSTNSSGGPGQAMSFGKSRARFQMEAKTGVMFDDVAGIEEAKEELQEVVTFLKKPERFTAVGARIPKGVLLIGPPGTGKTLLAKAIAGEAGVPFFSISGSEFVEMFVGVGASRVRDLFKKAKENAPCIVFIDEIDAVGRQRGTGIGGGNDEREQTLNQLAARVRDLFKKAKENAPCIVFIDEIDAVGRQRGTGIGGGNDEREQTLNQLLTEMDGFEGNTGIIIIAATNRPDVLDSALLRPGRFDRQVQVDLPNYKGRLRILEVHARNKKLSSEVSLETVARRTPGFSGADLANLLNEAAILTARRRKDEITALEIDDAIDRITIGLTLTPLLDSKKKRLIAYHEIGHALLMTLLKNSDPLNKVTIIPRSGGIGGFAQQAFNEDMIDSGLYTRSWMTDRITMSLGGRAAEEEIFGESEVTAGASGDIRAVADLAREMVTRYGMSDLGLIALEGSSSGEVFLGRGLSPRSEYSEEVATQIDEQVRAIAMQCYAQARLLIRENRALVDRLVEMLLEQETIEGEQFRAIVADYCEVGQPANVVG